MSSNNCEHGCDHSHSNQQTPYSQQPKQEIKKKLGIFYYIENICKFSMIVAMFVHSSIANQFAFFSNLLGIIRITKRPRWNQDYAWKVIECEFTHNLFYMVPFFFFPDLINFMYFLPLSIHFLLGLAEFSRLSGIGYNKLQVHIEKATSQRDIIKVQRCSMEFYLLLIHFFLVFVGYSNIFFIIFYANYIRVKYIISKFTQMSFTKLNVTIQQKIISRSPKFVGYIYGKIKAFCEWLITIKPRT